MRKRFQHAIPALPSTTFGCFHQNLQTAMQKKTETKTSFFQQSDQKKKKQKAPKRWSCHVDSDLEFPKSNAPHGDDRFGSREQPPTSSNPRCCRHVSKAKRSNRHLKTWVQAGGTASPKVPQAGHSAIPSTGWQGIRYFRFWSQHWYLFNGSKL